jgi:LysM repeat protein
MTEDKENYEAYNIGDEPIEDSEPEEEYYEEDAYDTLGDHEEANPYTHFLKNNAILLALIGVIIIVLVVLYQRLPKTPFETIPNSQLTALELRIEQLEKKLEQTEASQGTLEGTVLPDKQVELMGQRVGDMEAFVAKELETLTGRIDALEKSASKSSKAASTPTKKATVKTSQPTKTTAKYHTVQPGETLYSIATKYKTSIDELKRLNKISQSTIHPGDKLRVSR